MCVLSSIAMLGGKRITNGLLLTNGTKLEVFTGDLAETEVDVIVNTTGSKMNLSLNPLARALLKKGGQELQNECNNLAPMQDGNVFNTGGYGLPCYYVAHVCAPNWEKDKSEKVLKDMMTNCMQTANTLDATSIAFPAVATGCLGYAPETVAKVFLQACSEFASNYSHATLKEIKMVVYLYDATTKAGFEKTLGWAIKPYVQEGPRSCPNGLSKLTEDLPSTWQNPKNKYGEYTVPRGSKEWNDCIAAFKKSLSQPDEWTILEVKRVQNPYSYQQYRDLKAAIAQKLKKSGDQVEKSLWHGTKQESVRNITRNKFTCARAGAAHGAGFGSGSYFATTSEHSMRYCKENNAGEIFMIMVKVITGDYTKGIKIMKQAPYKGDSQTEQYDSVVDNVSNPSMFVVFNDASAYPEYVIKFKPTPPPRRSFSPPQENDDYLIL